MFVDSDVPEVQPVCGLVGARSPAVRDDDWTVSVPRRRGGRPVLFHLQRLALLPSLSQTRVHHMPHAGLRQLLQI